MLRLAIIGSGDLGCQIAYHAITDKQFEVVGFFDDFRNKGELIYQIPVLDNISGVVSAFEKELFDVLLVGIGYKHMAFRRAVYEQFRGIIPFARLIHSSCIVDTSSEISEGVVIYPGCIIDQKVTINENVLLNIGCCIAHDTVIGAHSFFSPRVAVAGFVNVESCCFLGINSTIIDNIIIAKKTRVGGGSVVIKNIDQSGLYVGNPIRFIK